MHTELLYHIDATSLYPSAQKGNHVQKSAGAQHTDLIFKLLRLGFGNHSAGLYGHDFQGYRHDVIQQGLVNLQPSVAVSKSSALVQDY